MNTTDPLKLDNHICFALYACSREMTKLYRPLLHDLGLTYTQYITMLALWEKDNISVSELGAKLYLDSGTLTPLLKKLEGAGWITRTRDPQDERSVLIALTDAGRALRERAMCIPEQLASRIGESSGNGLAMLRRIETLLSRIKQQLPTEP